MTDLTQIQKTWAKLLGQAMANEEAVGRLYARYAQLFPAQAGTWLLLARAEEGHATSLMGLLSGDGAPGVEDIPLEKLGAGNLEFVSSQVAVMAEKAAAGDVTESRAAANALLLESGLAESFLFDAAGVGDSPFRRVADHLCLESRYHRQIVLGLAASAPETGGGQAPPLWNGEAVIAPPATPSRVAESMAKQTVIACMARHEEAVARLYAGYAERFPASEAFWNGLAAEEKTHAENLRTLGRRIEEGGLDFSAGRFGLEEVRASTLFIENQIATARREPVTEAAALAAAQAVEDRSIEFHAFHVFQEETAAPEIRAFFAELHRQDAAHRDGILRRIQATAGRGKGTRGFLSRLFGGK